MVLDADVETLADDATRIRVQQHDTGRVDSINLIAIEFNSIARARGEQRLVKWNGMRATDVPTARYRDIIPPRVCGNVRFPLAGSVPSGSATRRPCRAGWAAPAGGAARVSCGTR